MTDNQHIFLNSIAYIANRFQNRTIDFHKLFKILYFAEQKHLVKYGSKLIEDNFVAMNNGPVPSSIYDMLKRLKDFNLYPEEIKNNLIVNGVNVTSAKEVDLDWLSESEIFCMNESIEENGNLSFSQLTEKSHDSAWDDAWSFKQNSQIDLESIAIAGGANEETIAYIKSSFETTAY